MNALDLIRVQMALEGIGVNAAGELIRILGPNPDTIARLHVVQHDGGYGAYPRHDLPEGMRRKLHALAPEVAFRDQEVVRSILEADSP